MRIPGRPETASAGTRTWEAHALADLVVNVERIVVPGQAVQRRLFGRGLFRKDKVRVPLRRLPRRLDWLRRRDALLEPAGIKVAERIRGPDHADDDLALRVPELDEVVDDEALAGVLDADALALNGPALTRLGGEVTEDLDRLLGVDEAVRVERGQARVRTGAVFRASKVDDGRRGALEAEYERVRRERVPVRVVLVRELELVLFRANLRGGGGRCQESGVSEKGNRRSHRAYADGIPGRRGKAGVSTRLGQRSD